MNRKLMEEEHKMKIINFQDTELNWRSNFAYARGYKTGGFA